MRQWPQPEDADLREWAKALVQELVKKEQEDTQVVDVGRIGEFPVAIPTSGWLACNGATFDALSFPALYNKLGTNVLPNLTPKYNAAYKVAIRAA